LAVGPPDGGRVGALGVGREIKNVSVAAGCEDDDMGRMRLDLTIDKIARDDAARLAVHHDEIEHLVTREHLNGSGFDLPRERRIRAKEKLLPRLSACVEGAAHLRATEGTVRESPAVFTGEGDALSDGLIDDVERKLGEPVNIRLAGAKVAALHRIVKEPEDAITVVLVVFRGVNSALSRDGVGAAGAVLVAEALDVVAKLAERRGGGSASEARTDDDHVVAAAVGGGDEVARRFM